MKISINGYIIPNEYKEVYDYYGYESCCPNDIKLAKVAAPNEPMEIVIGTCYGGSIFAGSEIGAEIKSHKGEVSGQITGLAASAASVISGYIDNLSMAPTAMIMVHNVSSFAEGDYHAMSKESDTLKQCNKAMCAAYVMKSGMSTEEALKMMDSETWLTAEQAKEKGLVDSIMFDDDPAQLVAATGCGMIPKAIIDKTRQLIAEEKEKKAQATENIKIAKEKLNMIERDILGS